MVIHFPVDDDDAVDENEREGSNNREPDFPSESPWLRKVGGELQRTRRLRPEEHVLVRCSRSSWFRGRIKRLARNGVRVWLLVSETLVLVPWELVSTHLVRLEDYASGENDNLFLRIRCVRPSHLSHRYLYERAGIVPYKTYLEEAVNRCSDPEQPKVFDAGSNELSSCLNEDTFYPRRPPSAGAIVTSKGFEPRILRETNPLCGISKDRPGCLEEKVDDDLLHAGKASCVSHENDVQYVSAYDEAQDPEDEKSMDEIRANLYQKFLARRSMLGTSTNPVDNVPSSSGSTNPLKSRWSPESAELYLTSKRHSQLFPYMQMPPGISTESKHKSEPCTNEDTSQHLSDRFHQFKNGFYPSKPRHRSGLYSMVETGGRSETESSFGERILISS